jgi:uncharacterized membrane protein YfcA
LLCFIGLAVGAFGTLTGVAGGFLLVPILLFLYPKESPAAITSITLTVAFFNALSGSIAYERLKRIDYRSGLLFAAVAVPGAIGGVYAIHFLGRGIFQYVFGSLFLIVAVYLVVRPERKMKASGPSRWHTSRMITDSQGNSNKYSFNLFIGMAMSLAGGIVSGLLGIGGGIIRVPVMTQILSFPVHIAGTYTENIGQVAVLAAGAVIGAQFGARISHRVKGNIIVWLLAGGLAIVAIKLLVAPF